MDATMSVGASTQTGRSSRSLLLCDNMGMTISWGTRSIPASAEKARWKSRSIFATCLPLAPQSANRARWRSQTPSARAAAANCRANVGVRACHVQAMQCRLPCTSLSLCEMSAPTAKALPGCNTHSTYHDEVTPVPMQCTRSRKRCPRATCLAGADEFLTAPDIKHQVNHHCSCKPKQLVSCKYET